MVKEKLQCQLCNKNWSRMRSRGRKPRFCVSCIENNLLNIMPDQELKDTVDNTVNEKLNSKNKRHWICPRCSLELITYVNLSQSPVCNNPSSHTSTSVEMIDYNRKEEKVIIYA